MAGVLLDLMLHKPGVGLRQSRSKICSRPPTQRTQRRRVEYLDRHAVRPGGIESDSAAIANHVGNGMSKLCDGEINAAAEVYGLRFLIMPHDEHAGVGKVGCVDELASRCSRAPYDQLLLEFLLGSMRTAQQ